MKLIFNDEASAGKVVHMAGLTLEHGKEVEVPAGLVDACLRSGKFQQPLEEIETPVAKAPRAKAGHKKAEVSDGRNSE